MMNKTKVIILAKSLKLFNKLGISNVSLRAIADAAGISVGNLQYHFKKREDIVEALYFQLVEEIDHIYALDPNDLLKSVLGITENMMVLLYEYHFFLLDFITITRKNEKIKRHYSELSKQRMNDFMLASQVLVKEGVFRKEVLKNEYEGLYTRMEVLCNFWFSSKLIQANNLSKDAIGEVSMLISQSIFPYLTDQARKQYADIFPAYLL